jgi:hypothetical protein
MRRSNDEGMARGSMAVESKAAEYPISLDESSTRENHRQEQGR